MRTTFSSFGIFLFLLITSGYMLGCPANVFKPLWIRWLCWDCRILDRDGQIYAGQFSFLWCTGNSRRKESQVSPGLNNTWPVSKLNHLIISNRLRWPPVWAFSIHFHLLIPLPCHTDSSISHYNLRNYSSQVFPLCHYGCQNHIGLRCFWESSPAFDDPNDLDQRSLTYQIQRKNRQTRLWPHRYSIQVTCSFHPIYPLHLDQTMGSTNAIGQIVDFPDHTSLHFHRILQE